MKASPQRVRVRTGIAAVCLVATLAVPTRAWASCPVIDIAGNFLLAEIIGATAALEATIAEGFQGTRRAIAGVSAAVTSSSQTEVEAMTKIAQSESDAMYAMTESKIAADVAMLSVPDLAAYETICRKIHGQQVTEYSRAAADSMASRLQRGIMDHARGLESGRGPAATSDIVAHRCGAGTGGAGGFLPPSDQPVDPTCSPQTGTNEERMARYDADINIETILPSVNKVPLEQPADSATAATVVAPNPNDNAQVMFIAGQSFCYNAAGPMDRGPWGRDLRSAEGKKKSALHAQCMSLRSPHTDTCFKQLMYGTRPDCSDARNAARCREDHRKCAQAVAAGVTLPASFGNCDQNNGEGLSPFQQEWLDTVKCRTSSNYVNMEASGAKGGDLFASSDLCQIIYTNWDSLQQQKRQDLMIALNALYNLRTCEKNK